MKQQKIAIIGTGNVGSALQKGLEKAGYEVRGAKKDEVVSAAEWAEVIFLAVPFGAVKEVAREISDAAIGKTIVDVTNALTPDMQLAVGFTTSGAEDLQKLLPRSNVVKSFNTVFAQHMSEGTVNGERLTVFAAGNNEAARKTVLELAKAIGFDAVDGGLLQNARLLEPFGYFNIQLGYVLGLGTDMGFRLIH